MSSVVLITLIVILTGDLIIFHTSQCTASHAHMIALRMRVRHVRTP